MKLGFLSLGCPKNQVDSEKLVGKLSAAGHALVDHEEAELVLLNTCSFIDPAKQESVDTILEMAEFKRRVAISVNARAFFISGDESATLITAGFHVVCDKPMTTTLADAEELHGVGLHGRGAQPAPQGGRHGGGVGG